MEIEIVVYPKNGAQRINSGEKAAISRKVRKEGFTTSWKQNAIVVGGPYYGVAVDVINALGYETDEDEA